MSNDPIATLCVQDILDRLSTLDTFGENGNKKIFHVYSEDDLFAKIKLVKMPACGVMYEGIFTIPGDPLKQGMMAEIRVAIAVCLSGTAIGNADTKNEAALVMDTTRKLLRMQQSPTMRPWAYDGEMPGGRFGNVDVYLQRWKTIVVLTS